MALRSIQLLFAALCVCCLPVSALAGTSNSLLDVSPDGARLLVANPDNGTVTVVDTKERKVLRKFVLVISQNA